MITNFIFTGKERYIDNHDELSKIIEKCITSDHANRYNSLDEMFNDINNLEDFDKKKEGKKTEFEQFRNDYENTKLDDFAIDMLHHASKTSGQIFKLRTLGGLSIQCGDKSYHPNSPKEEAYLEETIENLVILGYIKSEGEKDEIFRLTVK